MLLRSAITIIAASFSLQYAYATLPDNLSAGAVLGPAGVDVNIAPQPPARLIVDPPLPGPLATGMVFIQYRAENMRIEPVFGPQALRVVPRIGHIHVIVDDNPWHWADASGEPVILVGLPADKHKVTIILADPTHKPVDTKTVEFTVPETAPGQHHEMK